MLTLDDIKRLAIIALASDDELVETLVLKGGNAIELMDRGRDRKLSRASSDLDFSIEGDFDEMLEDVKARIEKTLAKTFLEHGAVVIDYRFVLRPSVIRDEVKNFWGGYNASFKLTTPQLLREAKGDLATLQRSAFGFMPNGSTRFEIEISKYEYTGGKIETKVDGYQLYIYSPQMIVLEKLRAICQQLPAYAAVIPSYKPRPRARDFYDIYLLMDQHQINPGTPECKELLMHIFEAKKSAHQIYSIDQRQLRHPPPGLAVRAGYRVRQRRSKTFRFLRGFHSVAVRAAYISLG